MTGEFGYFLCVDGYSMRGTCDECGTRRTLVIKTMTRRFGRRGESISRELCRECLPKLGQELSDMLHVELHLLQRELV
jgi:hypothetical protein